MKARAALGLQLARALEFARELARALEAASELASGLALGPVPELARGLRLVRALAQQLVSELEPELGTELQEEKRSGSRLPFQDRKHAPAFQGSLGPKAHNRMSSPTAVPTQAV